MGRGGAPAYESIRSLFPIPYLTMHLVVRAGVTGAGAAVMFWPLPGLGG